MLYRVQLIPKARPQRPGYLLWAGRAASLTFHNTANPNATAANHADYFGREDTKASAHIFVDDREAVMTIPLNEHAWHAGITAGNATSIGIEVCEFSNRARQDKTDANAQRLTADMLTGKAPAGWNVTHLTLKDVRSLVTITGGVADRHKVRPGEFMRLTGTDMGAVDVRIERITYEGRLITLEFDGGEYRLDRMLAHLRARR